MSTPIVPKLFQPVKVSNFLLSHRVVLAPLTRFRASKAHVHGDLAVEYYGQRASVPGTLLVTEATFIAAKAGGYGNVPAIWSDEQVAAWKKVTDAVHAKGSRIFCQLWALGRVAVTDVLKAEDPSFELVAPSAVQASGYGVPRPLTTPEIKEYVQLYTAAAVNAIRAGFDGVELHGANGYLIDQFLQDVSNKRTDEYGGSIENRCRFALEVIESVTKAIGQHNVGIRLSPWGQFQDMRMSDPKPTFSHLVSSIAKQYPDFAYIHVVEPRVEGNVDRKQDAEHESNDFLREIWAPRPFIAAGGFTRDIALETAEKHGNLIAFGRAFIPNPDLPLRLAKDLPLTVTNRDQYYAVGDPKGYVDWPFSDDPRANL
ncbi:NADH:flavin oxidoreductase/NADH oxidase [Wolfiporia cocos MD-104 SS10]|uniref:NADH:flavin oxidoreductase/NADH oxidase n=1 Tax=Wolfiporia cocos (strain MD-104) TaxID=742152 RepID=A0A2H3JM87_WOLCO|nr:NADH:flavin oxidoreductase/NADH oxidase [Wolfiporia cocos MD-104 SS10]